LKHDRPSGWAAGGLSPGKARLRRRFEAPRRGNPARLIGSGTRRLQNEGLGEAYAGLKAAQTVGREIEARRLAEKLLRQCAADRGRLHEAVTREAAGRVDAVSDLPEDRVRVGCHVVEARPGAVDLRLGGRLVAAAQAGEPIVEQGRVDRLLEAPPRLWIAHRHN